MSTYLDLLYVVGLRSDCGYVRRWGVAMLLVFVSVVDLMTAGTFVGRDQHVYHNSALRRGPRHVVLVVAVILLFLVGVSNEDTEKVILRYWPDIATPVRRCLEFLYFVGCILGGGRLFLSIIETVFETMKFSQDRSSFGEFTQGILILTIPFFFMAIVCLCEAIRDIFLKRLDEEDVSLSALYQAYSRVRALTDKVSDGIMYALMFSLAPALWAIFLRFLPGALNTSNPIRVEDTISFILLGMAVIATITGITYPSILVDSGDLRMREIVVHSKDINRDQILMCLFLDGDQVGLHVFGTVFTKDLLTMSFRGFYILVGIIVTQAAPTEDTNTKYQDLVLEKLDRIANQTRPN